MQQRKINPWQWQDALSFSQAIEASGNNKVLYCSGQTSVDAQGRPLHVGNMQLQINQAFDNLETVLVSAGYSLDNVVRLNYFTTDMDAFNGAYDAVRSRLGHCQPAGTLLEVKRLAISGLLIEIEATAVIP